MLITPIHLAVLAKILTLTAANIQRGYSQPGVDSQLSVSKLIQIQQAAKTCYSDLLFWTTSPTNQSDWLF